MILLPALASAIGFTTGRALSAHDIAWARACPVDAYMSAEDVEQMHAAWNTWAPEALREAADAIALSFPIASQSLRLRGMIRAQAKATAEALAQAQAPAGQEDFKTAEPPEVPPPPAAPASLTPDQIRIATARIAMKKSAANAVVDITEEEIVKEAIGT